MEELKSTQKETDKKVFSAKQVYILVFAIVVSIAFLETSDPIWTSEFWREFVLKVFVYGAVVEFVVIVLGQFLNKD